VSGATTHHPRQPGAASKTPERIVLRSLPKVVFLYPTILLAIVSGFSMHWLSGRGTIIGGFFLLVLLANVAIIAFEFPRSTSLTYIFFFVAIGLGLFLLNDRVVEVTPPLRWLSDNIHPEANDHFYWIVGGGLAVVWLVVVFVERHFDYWEINANQIIHHSRVIQTVERYPTAGLQMEKDITDVFEFLLLRAGRLILRPTGSANIVLENVHNVNQREEEIQHLLGHIDVHIRRSLSDQDSG